jgi:type III secretion system FlhB-like substrate exporter
MISSTERSARIAAIADELGVALSGDTGTIEALCRFEIDETISRELYAVVSELLTYLWHVDSKRSAECLDYP